MHPRPSRRKRSKSRDRERTRKNTRTRTKKKEISEAHLSDKITKVNQIRSVKHLRQYLKYKGFSMKDIGSVVALLGSIGLAGHLGYKKFYGDGDADSADSYGDALVSSADSSGDAGSRADSDGDAGSADSDGDAVVSRADSADSDAVVSRADSADDAAVVLRFNKNRTCFLPDQLKRFLKDQNQTKPNIQYSLPYKNYLININKNYNIDISNIPNITWKNNKNRYFKVYNLYKNKYKKKKKKSVIKLLTGNKKAELKIFRRNKRP